MKFIIYSLALLTICQTRVLDANYLEDLQLRLETEITNQDDDVFGDRLENAIFYAIDRWGEKLKTSYSTMIRPLIEALFSHNIPNVAVELQDYFNCNTCAKLVQFISQSPNDELLIEAMAMTQLNACKAFFTEQSCLQLVHQQKSLYLESWFALLFTKDFICSYLIPICGNEPAYQALSVEDYARAVLADKPQLI